MRARVVSCSNAEGVIQQTWKTVPIGYFVSMMTLKKLSQHSDNTTVCVCVRCDTFPSTKLQSSKATWHNNAAFLEIANRSRHKYIMENMRNLEKNWLVIAGGWKMRVVFVTLYRHNSYPVLVLRKAAKDMVSIQKGLLTIRGKQKCYLLRTT